LLDRLAEEEAALDARDALSPAQRRHAPAPGYQARPAATPAEEHAASALATLAAADTDHARERNGEGFAASTQDGHRLAAHLEVLGGLSDDDWTRALAIARLHRRQVGEAP
jgi:hypothetical protein